MLINAHEHLSGGLKMTIFKEKVPGVVLLPPPTSLRPHPPPPGASATPQPAGGGGGHRTGDGAQRALHRSHLAAGHRQRRGARVGGSDGDEEQDDPRRKHRPRCAPGAAARRWRFQKQAAENWAADEPLASVTPWEVQAEQATASGGWMPHHSIREPES